AITGCTCTCTGAWCGACTVPAWGLRLVHRLGQLVARRGQLIGRRGNLVESAVGHRLLNVLNRRFNFLGVCFGDLVSMLLQHLFDVVDHRVRAIASFDLVSLLPVVGGVRFRVTRHL